MRMKLLAAVLLALGCTAFAGCRSGGYSGTGYEQNDNGGVLTGSKMTLTVARERQYGFTENAKYKAEAKGGETLLKVDEGELFFFVDVSYDAKQDKIVAYTQPMLDGDGGYKRTEFARTAYIPPAPPVYAPPVDKSDANAKKEFADLTVRAMKVSFYDAGGSENQGTDLPPMPPYAGGYSYDLTVLDDGTARVSSSFCGEIALSKETADKLQTLVKEANLGALNGLDVHTEGLPRDAADYTLELTLKSGEVIRSSANGDSVPENWAGFQTELHNLLFFAFVDAGYSYQDGSFHSTAPMKRVGSGKGLFKKASGVDCETIVVEPDWPKAYDYNLNVTYFAFRDLDGTHAALMKTLDSIAAQCKSEAEAALKAGYETMQSAPKPVREKAFKSGDKIFCHSLYSAESWELDEGVFTLNLRTGHMNTLGLGESGYGKYDLVRYRIDAKTGKLLSASDLFTGADALCGYLAAKMKRSDGTYSLQGHAAAAADFPAALKAAVSAPEPEGGVGWEASDDHLTLYFPQTLFKGADSQPFMVVYYDDMQDILGENYTRLRGAQAGRKNT